MSTSYQLVSDYAADHMIMIIFVMVCSASVIGHLLNKALGQFAFGMVGNSSVVLMSIIVAVSIGRTSVTILTFGESIRFVILAISFSIGFVLTLGALKAFLPRWRLLLREMF